MKDYRIIQLDDHIFLVIVLTLDFTNNYWGDLNNYFSNRDVEESTVYFDFMYKNGMKNRFFISKTVNGVLPVNSLKRHKAESYLVKIADGFWHEHSELIGGSVLTDLQKSIYKQRIASPVFEPMVMVCEPRELYSSSNQG